MKRKNAVIAFGLVLGFSATSVFADTKPLKYNSPTNELSDRFAQVQRQAIEAKSLFLDEVEKPAASVGVIKRVRTLPKLKRKKKPFKRKIKPPVAGGKKTFKEKNDGLKNSGKFKSLKNTETYRAKAVKKVKNKDRETALKLSKREMRIYNLMKNARNLERLTPAQKSQILALHKRVLKTKDARNLLKTIQIGEGGGPFVIVGKGYGKSKKFKTIMKRLDFSTHPAKQFPKGMRCLVFNRQVGKCSTASGSYQITESRNSLINSHAKFRAWQKMKI